MISAKKRILSLFSKSQRNSAATEPIESSVMTNNSPKHVLSSDGIWFEPEILPEIREKEKIILEKAEVARTQPWRTRPNPQPDQSLILARPLPTPPPGYMWRKDDENKHWECVCCNVENTSNQENILTVPEATWIDHVVMPEDTLQGICLRYRTSVIELRRNNNFSGNAFRSREVLRIRVDSSSEVIPQIDTCEVKIQKLHNIIGEDREECRYYLSGNDWDLIKALNNWQADENWEEHLVETAVECAQQSTNVVRPISIEYSQPRSMRKHEDNSSFALSDATEEVNELSVPLLSFERSKANQKR